MTTVFVPAIGDQPSQTITIPSRDGTSPIGTTSPNSGGTAATNSSYGIGAYTSGIAVLAGSTTAYVLNDTDYQGMVIFNTNSGVALTLNAAVQSNFQATVLNLGTGAITLTTSDGSPINGGAASLTLAAGQGVQVFFTQRSWIAYAGTTVIQVVPQTIAAVAGKFLTSYDATTGLFTQSTPAGVSGTVTLAALSGTGTQGSLTLTNGIVTAFVNPT